MKKRSLTIAGHRTSITLEEPFWRRLQQISLRKQCAVQALVAAIDQERPPHSNLSSALRVYILEYFIQAQGEGNANTKLECKTLDETEH